MTVALDLTDAELLDAIRLAVRTEPDEWTPAALADDLGVDSHRVQALLVGPLHAEVSLSSARRLRIRTVEPSAWRPTTLQQRALIEVRKMSPLGVSTYDLARLLRLYPEPARRCMRDLWTRNVVRPQGPDDRRKYILEVDALVLDLLDDRAWKRTAELRDALFGLIDVGLVRIALGVTVELDLHNHVLRRLHQRGAVDRMKDGDECVWRKP